MPPRKGIWYLAPILSLGIMHKVATCSVALPVVADSAIAAVDITAKLSGYDRPYKENASRIIKSLEDQLHIKIKQPRIKTSFFVCREIMLKSIWEHYSDFNLQLGFSGYLEDYYDYTKESLQMNGYLSENVFGLDDQTIAISEQGVVCLAPFDRNNPLGLDFTLGHEIMHSYVSQVNPNFEHVDVPDELSIHRLVSEGIAVYSADLVFGDGLITLASKFKNFEDYSLEDLQNNESLYYSLGTKFVSCAVDEIGPSALTLLAVNPPSTYEEIKNCVGYIHSIE